MAFRQLPLSTLEGVTVPLSLRSYLGALDHLAPGAIHCAWETAPHSKVNPDLATVLVKVPIPDKNLTLAVWLVDPVKTETGAPILFWRKPTVIRMLEAMRDHVRLSPRVNRWPVAVERVWNEIVARSGDPISLASLSRALDLSPGYLGERITRCLGSEFRLLLREERVAAAAAQLAQTNLAVAEICSKVSGQSLSQFNRAFLAATGISPREYRKTFSGSSAASWKSVGKIP